MIIKTGQWNLWNHINNFKNGKHDLLGWTKKKKGKLNTNNKLLYGTGHVLNILSIILHVTLVTILEMLIVS